MEIFSPRIIYVVTIEIESTVKAIDDRRRVIRNSDTTGEHKDLFKYQV